MMGYKIKPRWNRIFKAVALVMYTASAFYAGRFIAKTFLVESIGGPISDTTWYWIVGIDVFYGIPLLVLISYAIIGGLLNVLFDIEKQGDSA